MSRSACAALVLLGLAAGAHATVPPPPLDGTWIVDLSSSPDAPYEKPMTLSLRTDGTVTGSFYDTPIEAGRWERTGDARWCVSFRTTDGVGPYHTAACLNGDRVDGQTWAEGRGFLKLWTARRGA